MGQYLYLFGGRDLNDTVVSIVDRYDTIANTWDNPLPLLPIPLSDGGAFTSIYNETYIYLVGGYDQLYHSKSDVWVVDTSTHTYTNTSVPDMQLSRGDVAVVQVNGESCM
ncbi:hypothetical protein EON63_11330 [archaeon]|nr:MAG: hypothetical protein EON63_11330 [archaeon]